MIGIGDATTVDLTFGHTGRTERVSEIIGKVNDWASICSIKEMLEDPMAEKVDKCLREVPQVRGTILEAYRGRGIPEGPISSKCMGPPPADSVRVEGRYHKLEQDVLYLCNSELGVKKELEVEYQSGSLYIQAFELPLEQIRIADLTEFPPGHILTSVFARAEECQVSDRGPASYRFSQGVAELVRRHFRGMKVRGVAADPEISMRTLLSSILILPGRNG